MTIDPSPRNRLVVDGAAFQLGLSHAVALWESLLTPLARSLDLVLLDRGRAPAVPNATLVPFPSYKSAFAAADSILLDQTCSHLGADTFVSTTYTTPLRIPMVLLVDDGEGVGDRRAAPRERQERELAIHYACERLCTGRTARDGLLREFPSLGPDAVSVCDSTSGHPLPDPNSIAESLLQSVARVTARHEQHAYDEFFDEWDRLRRLQADVDF